MSTYRILLYDLDTDTAMQLKLELEIQGCSADICDGVLEMLRLMEKSTYDVFVLCLDRLNVETSLVLNAIDALPYRARVLLNCQEPPDGRLILNTLRDDFRIVRGALTQEKLLSAAAKDS
jgi:hypothetical protein